jgi:DMSO/TMAO reductase YedYZ heme-binding membrane subunit
MEEIEKSNNPAWAIIGWTLIFSMGYAILRYHIFGPVPWKDFPFFILNKGISLSAFILLTFNFTFGPLKNLGVPVPNSWLRSRRFIGIVGFILVFIHAVMSFMLFNPANYAKFFEENGTMTLIAGLSMLTGVLAFIFLWLYNISFNSEIRKDKDLISFITSRKVLLPAMFLGGAHLFIMGYKGWLNPGGWHGGLPPISLVAITFFVVGYTINIFGRPKDSEQ